MILPRPLFDELSLLLRYPPIKYLILKVPNRCADTLLSAIENNILPGSTIYSDSWAGYKTTDLEKAGFEHFKVNHK